MDNLFGLIGLSTAQKKLEEKIAKDLLITDVTKFGVGNPVIENSKCEDLAVFLACYGVGGVEC